MKLPENESYGWKQAAVNLRDKDVRQKMSEIIKTVTDPWLFVDDKTPCLHVWRIYKERPAACPVEVIGEFYQEEVFIVLNINVDPLPSNRGIISIKHVHIWVGKNASEKDYKAGFFWANQLDVKLGKGANMYREVQGVESPQFRSYFNPIVYWNGKFEDSYLMKKVKDEFYGARLLKLYKPEKREVYIVGKEVACNVKELDPSFTFVLDTGKMLYIWHGNLTPTEEDLMCTKFVEKMRANRGCETKVEALDDDTETDAHEFFTFLARGGRNGQTDDEVEGSTLHRSSTLYTAKKTEGSFQLYKVTKDKRVSTYNQGFTKAKEGKLSQKDMAEKYPICIYCNNQNIFVVLNKKMTKEEPDVALQYGHDFAKTTRLPFRPIMVVKYRQFNPEFKKHTIQG